jgi:hypothetical protein
VRRPVLTGLLHQLEAHAICCRVGPDSPPLPPDPWAEAPVIDNDGGLRAPIVAHWAVTYRCNLHCPF